MYGMVKLMLKELDNYDWQEAFGYAGEQGCQGYAEPQPVANFKGDTSTFARKDVKTIVAMDEGCNDEESWLGVFELKDGRFAYLEAWCDYTGWD